MIFISYAPGFILCGIKEQENYHPANGRYLGTTPGIDCHFRHGGCPDWAKQLALKEFAHELSGIAEGVDPMTRISIFDTDMEASLNHWTTEQKQEIEEILVANEGSSPYIRIEIPHPASPWPKYDEQATPQGRRTLELVAEMVARKTAEDGYDPEDVKAYDRWRFGERSPVIEALDRIRIPERADDDLLVEA